MSTLILARHGESAFGGNNERYCGWSEAPLTVSGRAQAARLADRLRDMEIRAVWSSDLSRARATAELAAAPHGLAVSARPELREQNYGAWEGLTTLEVRSRWEACYAARDLAPGEVAPPGGESYADMLARAWPLFEVALVRAQSENVLVVAHRGVNRVLLARLLEAPLNNARRIHQLPTCVNLICVSGARVQVAAINDCHHLETRIHPQTQSKTGGR